MDTTALNAVNQISKNANHKHISKSALQTLIPKAAVTALTDLLKIGQLVVQDGKVTYGEYIRLMNGVKVVNMKMSEAKKRNKALVKGYRIKGKPTPTFGNEIEI